MSESSSHKRANSKASGKSGKTEVKLKNNQRLDATTKIKATEIERSGTMAGLEKAALRLKKSGKTQKVLQVPQKDMEKAVNAMRKEKVSGTVKNMGGTKRKSIRKKK